MIWIITIYLFCSTAIAIAACISIGFLAGLSALGTGLLALAAAGAIKFGVLQADRRHLVETALGAIVVFGVSYLLSRNFSFHFLGAHVTGFQWGLSGAIIGFFCVTKHMTAEKT